MTKMAHAREKLGNNARAVAARALARIIGMNREPSWIAFDVLLPLINVSAYIFVYKALKAPEEYLGYVVLGGSMIGLWLTVLWGMASQLYWEKERGQLETVLMSPISPMALLIGMAFGGIYSNGLRALVTFCFGVWAFRIPIHVASWPLLLLTLFVTMAALYGLGMIGSSLFLLSGRNVFHMTSLLQEPVFLVSGFYFPVKALGFYVALAACIIPVTLGLDAMRQLLFSTAGMGFLPLSVEISALSVMSVIFFFLAHKALHYVGERARREGRLTMRWQ